jgi:FlaA1/EpsC-like NDP-sugar epimerase
MDKLTDATWGRILIDFPNATELAKIKTLPILDFHQKHINHFSIGTMNLLLDKYGFSPTAIETYTVETHNYPSFRILYDVLDERETYDFSKAVVKKNVEEKVRKLKEITEPVIVYGCGDICLHLLTQVNLNIVHYMDNDPAFIGHPINGIPVLDKPQTDDPIVIITQMQTELILERIKNMGITNKVHVI